MFTKEKYCAVCGCPFSLPLIHTPETDPNEDEMLILSFMYDPRVLPRELAVIRPNFLCSEHALIEQAVADVFSRGRSMAQSVGAKFIVTQTAINRIQTPALQKRFRHLGLLGLLSRKMAVSTYLGSSNPHEGWQGREHTRVSENRCREWDALPNPSGLPPLRGPNV